MKKKFFLIEKKIVFRIFVNYSSSGIKKTFSKKISRNFETVFFFNFKFEKKKFHNFQFFNVSEFFLYFVICD